MTPDAIRIAERHRRTQCPLGIDYGPDHVFYLDDQSRNDDSLRFSPAATRHDAISGCHHHSIYNCVLEAIAINLADTERLDKRVFQSSHVMHHPKSTYPTVTLDNLRHYVYKFLSTCAHIFQSCESSTVRVPVSEQSTRCRALSPRFSTGNREMYGSDPYAFSPITIQSVRFA